MAATENQTELRLTHRFDAPRERVFEAWTNPEVLRRWFAPGTGWDVPVADVDGVEGPAHTGESHVVVEFLESSDGTEVVLTHTGLANQESRDSHSHGWEGIFSSLETHLAG